MESSALLSPTDVRVIRRYVQTKYEPLPGSRKAEIVADAVRNALYRRLPDLPEAVRKRLADELIRRCLVKERREVGLEDVLDACAEMRPLGVDLVGPLLRWANERSPGRWSAGEIAARISGGGTASPAAAMERPAALPDDRRAASTIGFAGSLAPEESEPAAVGRRLFPPRRQAIGVLSLLALAGGLAAGTMISVESRQGAERANVPVPAPAATAAVQTPIEEDAGMPDWLTYEEFDAEAVKQYLRGRDSMLADEPYFGAIVESARRYDVHPLLLFAITGQEQGFVPKSHERAERIANNPFNVFHSWQDYNTDIADSSAIAAKLIAKLGKSRPEGAEPFAWFNRTYAEDPKWSDGVRQIFEKLSEL